MGASFRRSTMDRDRLPGHVRSDVLASTASRRTLLKGLATLMAAGAIAPLAAACGQPAAPPPKPAESKPAEAKPAESKPAAQPAAQATPAPKVESKPVEATKPTAAAAGEPKKGGTLKVGIVGEPPALDPTFTTATITANVTWHIFEGLFARNSKQEPVPHLLEKFDVSSDGKNWQFNLRKGVPFHNDKEMTSADVVASLKRWMAIHGRGNSSRRHAGSLER
jgi:peptide/nickel transport system substrate-binding protein